MATRAVGTVGLRSDQQSLGRVTAPLAHQGCDYVYRKSTVGPNEMPPGKVGGSLISFTSDVIVTYWCTCPSVNEGTLPGFFFSKSGPSFRNYSRDDITSRSSAPVHVLKYLFSLFTSPQSLITVSTGRGLNPINSDIGRLRMS